jgi:hypothetical protein
MIIEMNIEAADLAVAEQYVRDLLPGPRGYVKSRVAVVKYQGPKGEETNGVLIVRAVVTDKASAIGYAYQIAERFEQDCVAVIDCSPTINGAPFGTGMLIGPNAVKWAPFNPEFFKRF